MLQDRYIELLKNSLLNELYLENEVRLLYIFTMLTSGHPVDQAIVRDLAQRLPEWVKTVMEARQEGKIWWRVNLQGTDGTCNTLNLRNVCEFSHTMVDYNDFEPCRRAITEFRETNGISDPIEIIDWTGVFWRKTG